MEKMIIYEDNALLIVHKPAGLATQTARVGEADLASELKNYRKCKGEDTYIGVVHRLDQPVEGLLAFAKTQSAAAALNRQLQDGTMKKSYLALVAGELSQNAGGELVNFLLKDSRAGMAKIVNQTVPGAKEARLCWKCVEPFSGTGCALVKIQLLTGRFHQIRAQMAGAGMPLLGDLKYGSGASKALSGQLGIKSVMLFANELTLRHPTTGERLTYTLAWDVLSEARAATGFLRK